MRWINKHLAGLGVQDSALMSRTDVPGGLAGWASGREGGSAPGRWGVGGEGNFSKVLSFRNSEHDCRISGHDNVMIAEFLKFQDITEIRPRLCYKRVFISFQYSCKEEAEHTSHVTG